MKATEIIVIICFKGCQVFVWLCNWPKDSRQQWMYNGRWNGKFNNIQVQPFLCVFFFIILFELSLCTCGLVTSRIYLAFCHILSLILCLSKEHRFIFWSGAGNLRHTRVNKLRVHLKRVWSTQSALFTNRTLFMKLYSVSSYQDQEKYF